MLTGYTQVDLAAEIGVSQVMISHWELQKRTLDETRMQKIISILGAGMKDETINKEIRDGYS